MSKSSIWPEHQDVFNSRPHNYGSASVGSSPVKGRVLPLPLPDYSEDVEDDQAYLSSSSASSSSFRDEDRRYSSRKNKPKSNSRVHGIIASLERSASIDGLNSASPTRDRNGSERERRGSTSSVDGDGHRTFQFPVLGSRPLPFPPAPPYLIKSTKRDEAIPTSSFSFSSNAPLPRDGDGYDVATINLTPQTTSTRSDRRHLTGGNPSRPLPSPPPPLFLRNPQFIDSEEDDYGGEASTSEMTVEELLASVGPEEDHTPIKSSVLLGNVTTRRSKKSRSTSLNYTSAAVGGQGASAWENMDLGETVKRAPSTPAARNVALTIAQPVPVHAKSRMEEELTVEELLALEGEVDPTNEGNSERDGVGAWLAGSAAVVTVKRVAPDSDGNPGRVSGDERIGAEGRDKEMGPGGLGEMFSHGSVDGHFQEQDERELGDPRVQNENPLEESHRDHDKAGQIVIQSNFARPVIDATHHVSEDPAISILEAQMEETRRMVELLRMRVEQVEESVARMEDEFEMENVATREKQQRIIDQNETPHGRVDAEVQANIQMQRNEYSGASREQADRSHPDTWIRTLNALFVLPRYALGLYHDHSSACRHIRLYKAVPQRTLNFCASISRYVFGVPRFALAMGFAVPRYTLLLGIGVCVLVLQSVNVRGRRLLKAVWGSGRGGVVGGRLRR